MFRKISILVEINEKFRFFSKISKNVDLGQIFEKISILVKFFERISILVKILEKFRFSSKTTKNVDFGQILDFFENFENSSNLVKFSKNFDFRQIFKKIRVWSNFLMKFRI